jgi:hypothetical protein
MSIEEFSRLLMFQMLGVERKSLVILIRNSGHFGGALVWMFQMIFIEVNSLIFNTQG